MGLKTKNFKIKSMNNFMLENAYAYIIECQSDRKTGYADIGIFADRESAVNGAEPFETERVWFKVDRNENDRVTAYKEAKKYKEIKYNGETHIVSGAFSDWEDDII